MVEVTGETVNRVELTAIGRRTILGTLRKVGLHHWKEDVKKKGKDTFDFIETHCDHFSVHLFDKSRKVSLRIDLHSNFIFYSEDQKSFRQLYSIRSTSAKPCGWLTNRVDVGSGPRKIDGVFKQIGEKRWTEDDAKGVTVFTYEETSRDEWSVYLYDKARRVRLQLDMHRMIVRYGDRRTKMRDQYSIVTASEKLNGWLVNKVDFSTKGPAISGTFRQSGAKTWAEDGVVGGHNRFEFHERARDDWSVYLYDKSRDVNVQLDLHTREIYFSVGKKKRAKLYTIRHSDRLPSLAAHNAKIVNAVEVGDANGNVFGCFRQTSEDTWSEDGAHGERDKFTFVEYKRDKWGIYLYDTDRDMWVHIDLHKRKVLYHYGTSQWQTLYEILNTSAKLNGWMVNSVQCTDSGKKKQHFRQIGWTSWLQISEDGSHPPVHFDETHRDDWSVYLVNPANKVQTRINLAEGKVTTTPIVSAGVSFFGIMAVAAASASAAIASSTAMKIEKKSHEPEIWRLPQRISSRSSLTEDYDPQPGGRAPKTRPVYRTSVTLPSATMHVDVSASEEVEMEINGKKYTVDKIRSVRVAPSELHKLSISIHAGELVCPQIFLRTNLMQKSQKHVILPDVEVHRKIRDLKDGQFWKDRKQLGLKTRLRKQDVDDLQKAFQNIAATAQHSYNFTPHGVHHDRAVHPANMKDPHFILDTSGRGTRYSALTAAQVRDHIVDAERIDGDAGQKFGDRFKHFAKKATHIIVHTAENVAHDVVDTGKKLGHDFVETVHDVGEDLIHGDILEAGQDLIRGGEHFGKDLAKGVKGVASDTLKGVGQLAVVTFKLGAEFAGKVVQFVIHHTGFIGKALEWILEKGGAVVGKAVGWLLGKTGWGDILHTHDFLMDGMNRKLDEFAEFPAAIKEKGDKFFKKLTDEIDKDINKALTAIGIENKENHPNPLKGQSAAMEKAEWLLAKFFEHTVASPPIALVTGGSGSSSNPISAFEKIVEDEMNADGGRVREAFSAALDQLYKVFSEPGTAPQHILGAILDIVKGVAILGVHMVNRIFDELMDLAALAISGFKKGINLEWNIPFLSDFYEGITKGRKMSMLSIVSLIVAAPMTILYKAEFDERPFNHPNAALALPFQGYSVYNTGILYSTAHLLLSVFPIASHSRSKEIDSDRNLTAAQAKDAKLNYNLNSSVFSFLMNVWVQACANPISYVEPYSMPPLSAKHDVFEAPNRWAHIIWFYQMGAFFIDVGSLAPSAHVKSGGGGGSFKTPIRKGGQNVTMSGDDIVAAFTTIYGSVHLALMGVLHHHDKVRRNALEVAFGRTKEKIPPKERARYNALRSKADKLSRFFDANVQSTSDLKNIISGKSIYKGKRRGPLTQREIFNLANDVSEELEFFARTFFDSTRMTTANSGKPIGERVDGNALEWVWKNWIVWNWSKGDDNSGGLRRKMAGNSMDCLPEIAEFTGIEAVQDATGEWSLPIGQAVATLAHLSEAGVYATRTVKRELL